MLWEKLPSHPVPFHPVPSSPAWRAHRALAGPWGSCNGSARWGWLWVPKLLGLTASAVANTGQLPPCVGGVWCDSPMLAGWIFPGKNVFSPATYAQPHYHRTNLPFSSNWNKGAWEPKATTDFLYSEVAGASCCSGRWTWTNNMYVSAEAEEMFSFLLVFGSLQVFNGFCWDMLPIVKWFWSWQTLLKANSFH